MPIITLTLAVWIILEFYTISIWNLIAIVIYHLQGDPASGGGGWSSSEAASSRWPKVEVLALIKLRSNLENRYQEAGPKGPLWEEISAGMQRMGYNRSSKRCKEKWENINKYFKKVKESNKKRPEDAKTCPYFYELDAIYQRKILGGANTGSSSSSMVPFQQQQPQQSLALEGSTTTAKHQDTSVSNPGTVQTSATHAESINKTDGTDLLVQPHNGGLPDDIFGDRGGHARAGGGSTKPEDIMMELMKQQLVQQLLNLEDYEQQKMDELGDTTENVEEDQGEDEDESKEDRMAYEIDFQRPPTNNKNGGNNGAPSFITMFQ
uniref:Myb-like domain-containing protein n=1 Tax=Kalanchoe fedtschenkoi TaxID=63787 RepID=A0A7N0UHA9_KALFE